MNQQKKYDVVTFGEALIDFVPLGENLLGSYKAVVGGAPLNVAIGLSKLVDHVAMITRLGTDPFGDRILQTMLDSRLDHSLVQRDPYRLTPVSIIMPRAVDMLRYVIYRENGADTAIEFSEIPTNIFSSTSIFHAGTLVMSSSVSADTTRKAFSAAHKGGAIVSLDVNLRPGVWKNRNAMIECSRELIEKADIVKMTKDEAGELGFSRSDLLQTGQIVLITNGEHPARLYWNDTEIIVPSHPVKAIDVTGAGDAFMAAFLFKYLQFMSTGSPLDRENLTQCLETAVHAGALCVQRIGGADSFPSRDEV